MATKVVRCDTCGINSVGNEIYCRNCGSTLNVMDSTGVNQGIANSSNPPMDMSKVSEKKLLAGVLGIIFGAFGVHKFVLGYNNEGMIMIGANIAAWILTLITCGIAFPLLIIPSIIGIVEGIIYLTKTDEEFAETYIYNKKPWF